MTIQTYDDERRITFIAEPDSFEPGGMWQIGHFGITKIEAYREAGEMGCTLWFAIYKGDVLATRVNGRYIETVNYEVPTE